MRITTTTKGYFQVINNLGEQVSKHTVFQKALESAINSKSTIILFPDKVVVEYKEETDITPPDKINIISVT